MVGIWSQIIFDPFPSLKTRCHGNQFWSKIFRSTMIQPPAFRNGLKNIAIQMNADYRSTLCTNLVNFGPLIPEITSLQKLQLFLQCEKNWHIPANISESYAPIFTKFSALVELCTGILKLTEVSRQPKGCCYGNQLFWWLFADVEIDRLLSGVPKQIGISQFRFQRTLQNWTSFLIPSRVVPMATNLVQNWRTDLYLAIWHFKKDQNIAMQMNVFIAPLITLHSVQIW